MEIAKEPDIGKNTRRRVFYLVVVLLITSLPFWISRFGLALSTQIMYLSILVMSFTFMASHGGLLSLAQVSFFGIAGYTLGILSVKAAIPFPYPYILGILMAALGGCLVTFYKPAPAPAKAAIRTQGPGPSTASLDPAGGHGGPYGGRSTPPRS